VATVLVVDDDDAVRRLVCDVLEMEGHEAVPVPNGPTALEHLAEQRPDCVILDIMMPGMDGLTVLAQIRDQEHLADLPVALLTAAADDASVWRGWQSGASWFFTKPLDADAMLSFIGALEPGRKRRAAPVTSPYAIVAGHAPIGEAEEETLVEVVRALEAEALLFGAQQLVMTSVPGPDALRGPRMARLETLAERGADVVVLGRRLPRRVTAHGLPQLVPLRPDDGLQQEWVHMVCGPRLTSVLVSRVTDPGGSRRAFAVSHEVSIVAAVADAMLERVPHLELSLPPLPPAAFEAAVEEPSVAG
jgi:DNA-binding response OmpR family regulator